MGKLLHWIVILQLAAVSSALTYTYGNWYRADTKRPVDVITDVVNDLGVKILQQYSTHGNVAFSPTGVAFVLAALYEGSAGRGSQQILEAVGLPANRDVIRIGFRDIHRRLRSYLNADGFLGGLTLSRENTKLRSEYEDVLRFYGFDLSSIEQEANVTVSMEDTSGTTELPTSTIDLSSLPVETANTENAPGTTTTLTATVTALPPAVAETTTVPSSATAGAAQQTLAVPMGTNAPATVTSGTGSGTVAGNIPALSTLSTVTSGESGQPSTSAGAESAAGSPNAATPATSTTGQMLTVTDGQTSPSTVVVTVSVADDQNMQSPTMAVNNAVGDTATTATAVNAGSNAENAGSGGSAGPGANAQAPQAGTNTAAVTENGAATSTNIDTEVPSTLGVNTEMPTEVPAQMNTGADSATANAGDTNTAVVNTMTPADMSDINATLDTATSPIPAVPAVSGAADAVVPSTVVGPTIANAAGSQPNTEAPMSANIPGMTTIVPATTSMTNVDNTMASGGEGSADAPTPTTPPGQAANGVANGPAGNANDSTTAVNSADVTATTSMNNQNGGSLMDENTITMNRRKKSAEPAVELEFKMRNVTDDNTVKDESTDERPADIHKRRARSPRGYFSSYPDEGIWMQDLDIWKSYSTSMSPSDSTGDATSEIAFLVNGCEPYSVSGSRYIAVLPFAYFPSLHAVALEFPLDDPRYNIILLMPTDRTDTHRLARDLSGKSLRSLRKRLQPTWVRATIPSFMLRGFVTLTSFLQRLGILDVFEPRVADLSPMTADLGVYARDVQQSIGVNIRNYMKPDRTHSRNGLFERAGPVPFTAMHPFLYFIVDAETSVSLIAGRVDDPLNSRIL